MDSVWLSPHVGFCLHVEVDANTLTGNCDSEAEREREKNEDKTNIQMKDETRRKHCLTCP